MKKTLMARLKRSKALDGTVAVEKQSVVDCIPKYQCVARIDPNLVGYKNLCLMCGDDMGPMNPRQLCGKTCCLNHDP